MWKLASAAVRHPKTTLAVWLAAIGVLAFAGLGVEDRLHRTALTVEGTPSYEATEALVEEFGKTVTLAVMVEGPQAELDAQGPAIARRLDEIPKASVLTPWMQGSGEALRPAPDRALIVVRGDDGFEEVSRNLVPLARKVVSEVEPPLQARMTGSPDIAAGVHGDTIEAIGKAELIAAPLLLIVLLLVFRSPVAAAIPLALGMTTVAAGAGLFSLLNELKPLDAAGLNLTSMMGLALGVDYSLLLVSRFREELAEGRASPDAALVAVRTAGRTVLFAGIALALAMLVAGLIAPGDLLASGSYGVTIAAVIGVLGGLLAVPAMLTLLGENVNRWSFGNPGGESRIAGWALRALRRPVLAGTIVLGLVLAMAVPAGALETGPPDPRVLPASSPERNDYEAMDDALGPGWSAPYEIVVSAPGGTVTEQKRLAQLGAWQRHLAELPGVSAVYGPGSIADSARQIETASKQLDRAGAELDRSRTAGRRLVVGLDRAGGGLAELRAGLSDAASGAAALEGGAGEAEAGASGLDDGLARAEAGAERLRSGLAEGREGLRALDSGVAGAGDATAKLRSGLTEAAAGASAGSGQVEELADGLGAGAGQLEQLREPAQTTEAELAKARAALEAMLPISKGDPEYARAYQAVLTAIGAASGRHPLTGQPVSPGYDGLDAGIAAGADGLRQAEAGVRQLVARTGELAAGLARLEAGMAELDEGMASLDQGTGQLLAGMERLAAGGGDLGAGLGDLQAGGEELAGGLGRLRSGSSELAAGLDHGHERSAALQSGLARMETGADGSVRRAERLDGSFADPAQLAGPLGSGYFVLAAIDGSDPDVRTGATFAVNLDNGGTAAHVSVISKDDPKMTGHPLRERLEDEAARFEQASGMKTAVGGAAPILQDFNGSASGGMWLLVLLLCGVTWLVMVPVLRSLILPLLAVILNLLTVGAAFGVLVLLFQGDAPLGGAGFLDAIMVAGVFSVVFGLSIDYEVFLLARMREGWQRTGYTEEAVEYGLRKTAGVVTGAAAIMLGVFVVFSFADIASMRQLGIGLTVAILLDATLVRLVLLPAAIRLCGDRAWSLPAWLDRRLPNVDVEGPAAPARP